MGKYKSFNTEKRKIQILFDEHDKNLQEIETLGNFNIQPRTETILKNSGEIDIDTTLTFKDLYRFTGITFTTVEAQADPIELYDFNEDNNSYTFKFPVYGFPIDFGLDPEEVIGGTWEFQTTVALVKSELFFPNLTDRIVSESRIFSYLFTPDNGIPIPDLSITIDPIKLIKANYNVFYLWEKEDEGYKLFYYAFFPYPDGLDLNIKAKVVIQTLGDINGIQSHKT